MIDPVDRECILDDVFQLEKDMVDMMNLIEIMKEAQESLLDRINRLYGWIEGECS